MKQNWLITAFDAFAGRPDNNSATVLNEIRKLADSLSADPEWKHAFHFQILPTVYDQSHSLLMDRVRGLEKEGVALAGVLSLGEGAEEFKLETQANNLDDVAGFPDNQGITRVGKRIFAELDEDDVIPMRFPFEAFARIRTSKSPGFFVCNNLCARMAREFSSPSDPYFGFIHVPRTGMGGIFTAEICAAIIVNGFNKID
jgi:pyrrolidone-carboxylate peptidase